MIIRIIVFLLGFGFSVIGFAFIISYLNLIPLGYNFLEYVNFISRKPECLIGPLGLLTTFLAVYTKGDKNELYI
ncbi:MAG: hypothetical protein IKG27_04730 [Bacilli bacterium]|nr:hypothetical protein [Bacilli bacterium]